MLDNALRPVGIDELAAAIGESHRDYRFFFEVRASATPHDFLRLFEIGCAAVQVGIEGLCSKYLARLGKGTTTVQNLRAMRTCLELGIENNANLIIGFPGATREEIEETEMNIRRYAISFQPLSISRYVIDVSSSVYCFPERFGVSGIRNRGPFREALPEDVQKKLRLAWLEYDGSDIDNWQPVVDAVRAWHELHRDVQSRHRGVDTFNKPLFYRDGGDFLEIVDRRNGCDLITLDRLERDIYVHCMDIRSKAELVEKFGGEVCESVLSSEILEPMLERDILFHERGKYLALAVAWRRDAAIRRMELCRKDRPDRRGQQEKSRTTRGDGA
jgi:hypothetical protein